MSAAVDPAAAAPVAAIDCGTNAIRLLIASVDGAGHLQELVREMRIVRLGEGVDATGAFSQAALARTFAACEEYADLITSHRVRATRFAATSASRDVSNREAFIAGVQARLGVAPDVISGTEEAELSFLGAVRGLRQAPPAPILVVDIGGGSTEFVLGSREDDAWRLDDSMSVDVGCVRMTERHLHGDPPTGQEIARVAADLNRALDQVQARMPIEQAAGLVGLAGTVTTVAAMAMDLGAYDADLLHGAVIAAAQVSEVTGRLLAMSRKQRAALPFMHPGRVDVIAGGAMVLEAVMRRTGHAEVIVSECDLLDGIVYRLVQ